MSAPWVTKKDPPPGTKPTNTGPKKTIVKQQIGSAVGDKVKNLQAAGIKTLNTTKKLKTPKVVTDVSETIDKKGNVTRTTVKYITEVDGVTKRTERFEEFIPADQVE